MSEKQVIINVSAKDFIVKCSEEFAHYLENDIALISNGTQRMELKTLVDAFVKKSYDSYILEKDLKKLIKTINEEVSFDKPVK
ncbi:hypothetical protein [Campylobacter sp. US33a]|uniref:Uncharacterized protein n=1 Tax=Campylobacter sp. CCS1377 TaxID=3158229 RepID=A0AAU7E6U1_9BACT|nr:hypothetical protein [Campylobacter sp. US33a]MCW1360682.1 hypothetical protein [Campylobacter jejuni]TEY04067.1 hypothetical protein ELQ16_02165 [Campylobacter sp. US33a]